MVGVDQTELRAGQAGTEPADVVDRLLWRDAQFLLGRHAEQDADGSCVGCGWRWPCAPRRLAERADTASRRPWRVAWTLRHDLNSIRAMPGLRAGFEDTDDHRSRPASSRRNRRRMTGRPAVPNRGYFDEK